MVKTTICSSIPRIEFIKATKLPAKARPNTVYYIKGSGDTLVKSYITDNQGNPTLVGGEDTPSISPPVVYAGGTKNITSDTYAVSDAFALGQGLAVINNVIWELLESTIPESEPIILNGDTLTPTITNLDLSNGIYRFKLTATDSNGLVNYDILTIRTTIESVSIEYGYTSTDPYTQEDQITLQYNKNITSGSNYVLDFENDANLNYLIIAENVSEPIKTLWVNEVSSNNGDIPDSRFRTAVEIGQIRYYVTRVPFPFYTGITTIEFKKPQI